MDGGGRGYESPPAPAGIEPWPVRSLAQRVTTKLPAGRECCKMWGLRITAHFKNSRRANGASAYVGCLVNNRGTRRWSVKK